MPLIKCKRCKKEFYAKPSQVKLGWGKYCSSKCQYEAQKKGKFIACDICGKETWKAPKQIEHSKSGKFFCSKSCQTLWRNKEFRGPRHGNWKGGARVHYKKILIENNVKLICKLCGCNDERMLVVHHLDRNRKHNDIKNLVWLCHNCHHLVHCYNVSV